MRRSAPFLCCVLATVFVAGCSERSITPTGAPQTRPTAAPTAAASCPAPEDIRALIESIVAQGKDRSAALSRFNQIIKALPDNQSTAQGHALQLVDFMLKKFYDGRLIGGMSVATRTTLETTLNGILCLVGLPPLLPGVLDPDGAAAIVTPTSPTTNIVTGTEWAGVQVPTGAVTQPTLITIRRLPNSPHPLLTQLDQYPLFYEYDYNPGLTFTVPVLVGVCTADGITAPDPTRLRVAHNVAPYTPGSIEILPFVAPPFLDCTDSPFASAARDTRFDLARGGVLLRGALAALLPQPLEAATRRYAGTGVGGTVRTFSPFGLVDTLAYMSKVGDRLQSTYFGDFVDATPTVQLTTPLGRPMVGIPVTFTTTAGGIVANPVTVTDASGVASAGSWQIGFQTANGVTATATMTAGSGLITNPLLYSATGLGPKP